MKYLFDASAIFRAIKENKVDLLAGNARWKPTRYELGNIIWKHHVLQAKISKQESQQLAKTIKHTLNIMDILPTAGNEEEYSKQPHNSK